MNELIDFIEAADETSARWIGLIRTEHEQPLDAQIGIVMGLSEDWEREGPVLVAVASGGNDLSHVAITVNAFRDGQRIEPNVMVMGDEIIITVQNA